MTLLIYDVSLDERREATQEDIDRLCKIEQMYGALRTLLRRAIQPIPHDHPAITPRAVNDRIDQELDKLRVMAGEV